VWPGAAGSRRQAQLCPTASAFSVHCLSATAWSIPRYRDTGPYTVHVQLCHRIRNLQTLRMLSTCSMFDSRMTGSGLHGLGSE
jgi:hypothetical protein